MTKHSPHLFLATAATLFLMSVCAARTAVNSWTGLGGNADWSSGGNWSAGHAPEAGENVLIENTTAVVAINNSTPALASFKLANATLLFTNWPTTLCADTIEIADGGTTTLAVAFANATVSNRISFVCENCTVAPLGVITANARGFSAENGPGASATVTTTISGGAGHGGAGGIASSLKAGGAEYGSITQPDTPGSGSGKTTSAAGAPGGGVIYIRASGRITINGFVTANGNKGTSNATRSSGGGAGGSIWLDCDAIEGNGIVQANGGAAGIGSASYAGGGGGGRIAVRYNPASQASLGKPAIRFATDPGASHPCRELWKRSDWGTIYLSDATGVFNPFDNTDNFRGYIAAQGGIGNLTVQNLSLTNGCLGFLEDNFSFLITDSIKIASNAALLSRGPATLSCASMANLGIVRLAPDTIVSITHGIFASNSLFAARKGSEIGLGENLYLCGTNGLVVFENLTAVVTGNVTLAEGATLRVFGGATNGLPETWGARLSVLGDFRLETGACVEPTCDPLDGGAPLFQCANLWVESNSCFNADGLGFAIATGPGTTGNSGTSSAGGAGHGGAGGTASSGKEGGQPYGDRCLPILPGSGSADSTSASGGAGGGVIRIEADERIQINGALSANGAPGAYFLNRETGGGAGGSILLVCKTFTSTNGVITANGGDSTGTSTTGGGGGGGGRIALYYDAPAQALLPRPEACFFARPGNMYRNQRPWRMADWGTICLPDAEYVFHVSETISGFAGHLVITSGIDALNTPNMLCSNAWIGFETDNVSWNIAGNLTILTNAGLISRAPMSLSCSTCSNRGIIRLDAKVNFTAGAGMNIHDAFFSCLQDSIIAVGQDCVLAGDECRIALQGTSAFIDGSLFLRSGALLAVFGGATNGPGAPAGALISCNKDIVMEPGSTIHPYSHTSNGGSPLFKCRNMYVLQGAEINADSKGFAKSSGFAPGQQATTSTCGGGGYGGAGGTSSKPLAGGNAYGHTLFPVHAGSGGGSSTSASGGAGGGVIRIEAHDQVLLDGVLTANGSNGGEYSSRDGGGGAGGSIYLVTRRFNGAGTGLLEANGGSGGAPGGGGGAGGRIAVWTLADAGRAAKVEANTNMVTTAPALASFLGNTSALGGAGYNNGENGTAVFIVFPINRGVLLKLK